MSSGDVLGVVLGALSIALLVGAIAVAIVRARRRDARLLAHAPLARFTWSPAQWDAFLRFERGKHGRGVVAGAVLAVVFLGFVWFSCIAPNPGAEEIFSPWKLVAGGMLFVLVTSAAEVATRHYLRWSLRRGEVRIYPFGVVISGVLLDWVTRSDLNLRSARLSDDHHALELVLQRRSSGGEAESWFDEDLRLPLPPGVDGERILRGLLRVEGDAED